MHMVFWPSGHLVIQPSGHLAIQPSGHPVIWSSRLLAIRSSGHPVIWSFDHTAFWSSGHPDFWQSGLPAIQSSDHLVIQSSGHLAFWPSSLPAVCPDVSKMSLLEDFLLHQFQIPNVLPVSNGLLFRMAPRYLNAEDEWVSLWYDTALPPPRQRGAKRCSFKFSTRKCER